MQTIKIYTDHFNSTETIVSKQDDKLLISTMALMEMPTELILDKNKAVILRDAINEYLKEV